MQVLHILSRSNVPKSSSSKGMAIKHVTFEHQMLYWPIKIQNYAI